MMTIPSPIRNEDFDKIWAFTSRKCRLAKKMQIVRNAADPIAQLLFFAAALFLSYGAAYTLGGKYLQDYFRQLPALAGFWKQYGAPLFAFTKVDSGEILLALALLYLLPLCGTLIVALPVLLLYHPQDQTLPGDTLGRARELRVAARHAQAYSYQKISRVKSVCLVVFAVISIAVAAGFLLYGMHIPALTWHIGGTAPKIGLATVVGAVVLILCYALLNMPLELALKHLYGTRIPKNLVAETEEYFSFVQKQ